MLVKDAQGNEIEIEVHGAFEDDIQIESAVYVDSDDEVDDDTIEYILDHYASEIYDRWYQRGIDYADAYGDEYA